MPEIRMVYYRTKTGTIPLLDWFDSLPKKAIAKCRVRMDLLQEKGHELRRPHGDYLRDDIYELKASLQGIHYRVLYFFHENTAVVVSHGIVKEKKYRQKRLIWPSREERLFFKIRNNTHTRNHYYEETKINDRRYRNYAPSIF